MTKKGYFVLQEGPRRSVPAAWEVGADGMVRLDGVPVFVHRQGMTVEVKDRDHRRAGQRGSEFVEGDLLELVGKIVERGSERGAG